MVSAIPADPGRRCILFKHLSLDHIFKQFQIPSFMLDLHFRDKPERGCHPGKTLLLGNICGTRIKLCPFLVLALSRRFQVLCRIADAASRKARREFSHAAFKKLEEPLGMFLLIVCGLKEDGRYLLIPFFFRRTREEGVAVTCLRFSRKRRKQILFCFGSFDLHEFLHWS
jgi:hypothetical protein